MYMITKKKKCLVLKYLPTLLTPFIFSLGKKFPLNFTFCKMKYPSDLKSSSMQLHHRISFDVIVKMLFRHFAPGNQQNKTNMH